MNALHLNLFKLDHVYAYGAAAAADFSAAPWDLLAFVGVTMW